MGYTNRSLCHGRGISAKIKRHLRARNSVRSACWLWSAGGHPSCRHSRTGRDTFASSGSSSIRLIDIEHLGLGGSIGAILGRFSIVAVPMEHLKGFHLIRSAQSLGDDVVKLRQVSIFQVESTGRTASLLLPQKYSHAGSGERVLVGPLCPVHQVPIIGGRPSFDLRVPLDFCPGMGVERCPLGLELHPTYYFFLVALRSFPIPCPDPSFALVWVSPGCPLPQPIAHIPGHLAEDSIRHHRSVVIRPSAYDGVQAGYELFLGRPPQCSNGLLQFVPLAFLGFWRGFDESLVSFLRAVFARSKVAYLESQKVEPPVSLICLQRVSDPGFARLHFQSHSCQPLFRLLFCFGHFLQGRTEDHKVVSIPDDLRVRGPSMSRTPMVSTYRFLYTMECDVG